MESVRILRATSDRTAVLLLATGAVVHARLLDPPLAMWAAQADHPLTGQARLGPYSMDEYLFTDSELRVDLQDDTPAATTRFLRVLTEE